MNAETQQPQTLQPLGNYEPPSLPTADTLHLFAGRIQRWFRQPDEKPFIGDDHLHRSTLKMLDRVAAPPASGPLLEDLQATLADWVSQKQPLTWHRLIVLPPGDEESVVERWAQVHGHTLLAPPERGDLLAGEQFDIPELTGEGVLVIAQLERWFLRHRNGLHAVRALLARLEGTARHCVIGCNSWAWAFLCRAAGANLVFPNALTLKAFDAQRLRRWLSDLSQPETGAAPRFRLTQNGDDVMALDKKDQSVHEYFYRLAARSLGIPWVAWRLWRRSLRTGAEDDDEVRNSDVVNGDDKNTVWVAAFDEFSLPEGHSETALMVLHALLLHGAMTVEDLRQVLPIVGESNILPALIRAGFVERRDDQLACFAAAYPAIRSSLVAAGYSRDSL